MAKLFEGIRVLDFSNNFAGPLCATMLADFGAEVIKIERPVYGDDTRNFNPLINGVGISGLWLNRGKKSVTIALDDKKGIDIVKRMVADVDIIIEAFRPGTMKKFGLDYDSVLEVNPSIIYCSISAFGQSGPLSQKPGYDLIAQALSGLMEMTGEPDGPPTKVGAVIGDYIGTLNAYGCIAGALYHRNKTGEGQYIDIALLDGLVASHTFMEAAQISDKPIRRTGNHQPSALCPYGVFNGKNKQSVVICAPNEKLWGILCKLMDREDAITDPRFATGVARIENLADVIALIESWLNNFEDISDAVKLMDDLNIPCCKIMKPIELATDENLIERGMILDYVVPENGEGTEEVIITSRGVWNKMSKTPGSPGKFMMLGSANHEILSRYGFSKDEIDEIQKGWTDKVFEKRKKK